MSKAKMKARKLKKSKKVNISNAVRNEKGLEPSKVSTIKSCLSETIK